VGLVKTLPLAACCAPLARPSLTDGEAADLERVFKALADRNRVKMLNMIAACDDAVCVCDLQDALELKQSTASYHLKQLTEAGLLVRERRGTFSYYRLEPTALERIADIFRAERAEQRLAS
jgi:ArsR family transcriptional regulator, arsenate/arsenite/antimonite-responsive transcriptional repressor